MADNTLPLHLGQRCLALVERTHQTISPRALPARMWTKRNAVAIAMLPEALGVLRAASAAFKIRVFLWLLAAVLLGLSPDSEARTAYLRPGCPRQKAERALGGVALLDRLAEGRTLGHAGQKFTGGKFKKWNVRTFPNPTPLPVA